MVLHPDHRHRSRTTGLILKARTIAMLNHSFSTLNVTARRRPSVYVYIVKSIICGILTDSQQIGINYFGQTGELRGCINDVKNIQNFLNSVSLRSYLPAVAKSVSAKYGYKREDMVTLTDDSTNPRMMPTRENIVCS